MATKINTGPVHRTPADLKAVIDKHTKMAAAWRDITPLARNEFICWITSAKKAETRARRLTIARDKLERGERRPCCWQGCSHREKIR